MHDHQFAHRDIKPKVERAGSFIFLLWLICIQNVLVVHASPEWWVKIADFGISKRIQSTQLRTAIGTELYLAPEVRGLYSPTSAYGDEDTFSLAVDIWSVGVIAFQMLTGRFAFPDGRQLFNYVVRESPFPVQETLGPECNAFLRETMAASPRHRPTSREALTHSWMASVVQPAGMLLVTQQSTQPPVPASFSR